MAFWEKKKIILAFLNNSSLRFAGYEAGSRGIQRITLEELAFSDSVVKDSGILDAEEFAKTVAEFLNTKSKWKKWPTLLVIPEEKTFVKAFELELGDLERKSEFRSAFINEIPFIESDLIVQEHLSGKILELSAVYREFSEKLQKPFLESKAKIAGMLSIPQAIALSLSPKEKTFLLAFYDNDLALIFSQNARVLFSETERVVERKIQGALDAFSHFVTHLKVEDVRSVSLIVGEDEGEEELKQELEARGYAVGEIQKIHILDFIAEYYWKNRDKSKEWDMLFVPASGWKKIMRTHKTLVVAFLAVLLIAGSAIGVWLLREQLGLSGIFTRMLQPEVIPEEILVSEPMPVPEATTTPETTHEEALIVEAKKSDYPVRVFNGTRVAGEAGRLQTILQGAGFTVLSVGNNEDQNQTLTTIFVGSNAPDVIISEIQSLLEKTYQSVVVSASPVSVEDIHIVIGRKK